MRTGIFGGSFDPIHNAHLIVAQLAREQLGLDEVRFVVAAAQPHKPDGHHTPPNARAAMVEVAIAGLPGFVLDRREILRGGPSYTIDTLVELREEAPARDLVLLIGADAAVRFSTWRRPSDIRHICQVAVFRRADMAAPVGFDLAVTVPALGISSTEIRARARDRLSLAGWVPPAVADYISGLRLYRSDRA